MTGGRSVGPTSADVAATAASLSDGAVAVYPTETFYGLGAHALDSDAVARVAALKGRDADKPIAVIVAHVDELARLVTRVPEPATRLIARHWPGPLTLVLPARPDLPGPLTAGSGVVGVRVSSHPVARALAAAVGAPLTATSANPAGAPAAIDLATARAYFGSAVDYLDGGTLAGGLGSTVVLVDDDAARVVRAGAIPIETLRETLGATPVFFRPT